MAIVICGYLNVYRSGYFHRQGKPHAYDRHSGDFYPTEQDAKRDIDPPSHYICTVPVVWVEEAPVFPNGEDSQPVPLHMTRARR